MIEIVSIGMMLNIKTSVLYPLFKNGEVDFDNGIHIDDDECVLEEILSVVTDEEKRLITNNN